MYGYPHVLMSRDLASGTRSAARSELSPYRSGILGVHLAVVGVLVAMLAFAGTSDPAAATEQAVRWDTGCHRGAGLWSGCLPTK